MRRANAYQGAVCATVVKPAHEVMVSKASATPITHGARPHTKMPAQPLAQDFKRLEQ